MMIEIIPTQILEKYMIKFEIVFFNGIILIIKYLTI